MPQPQYWPDPGTGRDHDQRTAALVGAVGRKNRSLTAAPTIVDSAVIGADELAEIETEAANLDIDTACEIALVALDKIIHPD